MIQIGLNENKSQISKEEETEGFQHYETQDTNEKCKNSRVGPKTRSWMVGQKNKESDELNTSIPKNSLRTNRRKNKTISTPSQTEA